MGGSAELSDTMAVRRALWSGRGFQPELEAFDPDLDPRD
jgi:hypothetical protein